jgi:hypothetical protein
VRPERRPRDHAPQRWTGSTPERRAGRQDRQETTFEQEPGSNQRGTRLTILASAVDHNRTRHLGSTTQTPAHVCDAAQQNWDGP